MWKRQTEANGKPADEAKDPPSPTFLSSASSIIGNVVFRNPAIIDGRMEGEMIAMTHLTIGENAEVHALIQAPSVRVCGKVTGDIISKRIELRPPAQIVGNLTSHILVVEEGTLLDGHCFMSERPSEEHSTRTQPAATVLSEAVPDGKQEPQQGISFFITKAQRADLRARGYNDAAIDKMMPGDAHKILGRA